jgi:hypothetical protein
MEKTAEKPALFAGGRLAVSSVLPVLFGRRVCLHEILESLQSRVCFGIFLRQVLLPPIVKNHYTKRRSNADSELPFVLAQEAFLIGCSVKHGLAGSGWRFGGGMFSSHEDPYKCPVN